MSRLRMMLGIIAIALLVAAPASATYMNLQADSNWSFAISPNSYNLNNLTNYADTIGNSTNPVETIPLTTSTGGPNVGASVLVNSLPNLLHQEANNNPGAATSHTHVSGQGPTFPGFLQQDAYESMRWTLVPTVSGIYSITSSNLFSVVATGDNSSGVGAYKVRQTYDFFVTLEQAGGGLFVSKSGSTNYANEVVPPNVVSPWTVSQLNQTQNFDLGSQSLVAGQTYYLTVEDEVYQYMYTQIPVPPSLILLGSGLLGLAGLGWRRSRKES
jgi:hypothetical protein